MKAAGSAKPQRGDPKHATLRVTISPSSTIGAILGKVRFNYRRVFESIPFWRYVSNSLLVVILATAGTLFSASFHLKEDIKIIALPLSISLMMYLR
jgi:hypothetical protein